jgi:hypothetical protein
MGYNCYCPTLPRGRHAESLAITYSGGDLRQRAWYCHGADFYSKRHNSLHRSCHSPHFNYDQLHDVLQCAGSELQNSLCSSRDADAHDIGWNGSCNFERQCEYGLHSELHFRPARLPERMRIAIAFAMMFCGSCCGLSRPKRDFFPSVRCGMSGPKADCQSKAAASVAASRQYHFGY